MTGGGRRDGGQATVELALLLPVVALLALAVAQVAVVAHHQVLVVHAAREAARAAAVVPTEAAVATAARSGAERAGALDPAALAVDARLVAGRVHVEVAYAEPTDLPLVGALVPDLSLRANATMRWEAGPVAP